MRKYLAQVDSGSDFWEFEFSSDSRAGSRKNMEDARRVMLKKFGKSKRYNDIIKVQINE